MSYSIAIDGPAGAGKSTIARKIAKELGFIYVDTGAMYRAMAYYLLKNMVDACDEKAISMTAQEADITIAYEQGEQIVLLNNENINGKIRTEEVGNMASFSSKNSDVRKKLVQLQQKLAEKENVVMDGRDIGTCVLPEANLKIFLTAESGVRAKRRYDELIRRGEEADLDQIEQDIISRDHNDMTRDISPLVQAEDAILIDSSHMTIEEVVQKVIGLYHQ